MSVKTIRVLLADDHPTFRAGVKFILAGTNELLVVGEAQTNDETLRFCQQLEPDVLVLDLKMPGPTAVETINAIQKHCPETKILILSGYGDKQQVQEVTALGIVGYVLKGEEIETLVEAIRMVAGGGTWFSQAIMEKLIPPRGEDLMGLSALTERERQVLDLLAQGQDNARIAAELHLAKQTVGNYLSRIYEKLGVRSRGEAILWAREHGLGKK